MKLDETHVPIAKAKGRPMLQGSYAVARADGSDHPVAVRITDMLGEEVPVVEDR